MKVALKNKTNIAQLTPMADKFYRVSDIAESGLGLIIRPTGKKTWEVYYKPKGSKSPIEKIIGDYPNVCYDQAVQVVRGIIAQEEQKRLNLEYGLPCPVSNKVTFKDWFETTFIPKYCSKNDSKTISKNQTLFKNQLQDLHNMPIFSVTKPKLEDLHTAIQLDHSVCTANRAITLVKHMYNILINNNLAPQNFKNPAEGIKLPKESPRRVTIPSDIMPIFLKTLNASSNELFKAFVKLSLFTGARKMELLSLKWEDVSVNFNTNDISGLESIHILKPKHKNEVGDRFVTLTKESVEIFKTLKQKADSNAIYVFSTPKDSSKYIKDYTHTWYRFLDKLKANLLANNTTKMSVEDINALHFEIHDLRRTCGSYLFTEANASFDQISKILGNSPEVVRNTYAHLEPKYKNKFLQNSVTAMLGSVN